MGKVGVWGSLEQRQLEEPQDWDPQSGVSLENLEGEGGLCVPKWGAEVAMSGEQLMGSPPLHSSELTYQHGAMMSF